jgi:uncharacterized protein
VKDILKEWLMENRIETKRIFLFLLFTFGIGWITCLTIYLTGGIINSPMLVPELGLTLALTLMSTGLMWSPALGHILTRLITREGFRDTNFRPNFGNSVWKYWLIAWLLPVALITVGAAIYFGIFPQQFDPAMTATMEQQQALLAQSGQSMPDATLRLLTLLSFATGLISAPIINSFFTFGEEYGWRGYLQPKLMPLGGRRAMLLMGLIWGVWHWPVIFMGYEYGFDYPGAPFVGPWLFVLFTMALGTIIGWLALRGRSVWPAVIAHAMINGFAAGPALFIRGEPNILLGPLVIGIIAMIPLIVFAAWLFVRPNALAHAVPPAIDTAEDEAQEFLAAA